MAIALVWAGGCQQQQSVASVNGEKISLGELHEYLLTKPKVQVLVNNTRAELPVADTLAFQAVRDIIGQKVLLQMAREEKVAPTDKDIDSEIAYRSGLDASFVTALKQRGLTMEAIRRLVTIDLCQYRLQVGSDESSMPDVEKYIQANPDKFVTPASLDLAWILAKTPERRLKAQAALDSGMDFKSVAREFSEAEGARFNDGAYPFRVIKEVPPLVRSAVQDLQPGDKTAWLQGEIGYAKLQCVSRVEAKPLEITTARKEYVRRQLSLTKGARKRDLGKDLADRVRASATVISDPSLAPMWTNYASRLNDSASAPRLPSADPGP